MGPNRWHSPSTLVKGYQQLLMILIPESSLLSAQYTRVWVEILKKSSLSSSLFFVRDKWPFGAQLFCRLFLDLPIPLLKEALKRIHKLFSLYKFKNMVTESMVRGIRCACEYRDWLEGISKSFWGDEEVFRILARGVGHVMSAITMF